MPGWDPARSERRFAVSEFSAAFAALYAERIETIVGQFRHQLADTASGVVHPDVDVPERINRPIAQPLDLRAAGHIRRHRQRPWTRPRRHLVQLALPASREHHPITACTELRCQRGANPLTRSGDDDIHRTVEDLYVGPRIVTLRRRSPPGWPAATDATCHTQALAALEVAATVNPRPPRGSSERTGRGQPHARPDRPRPSIGRRTPAESARTPRPFARSARSHGG